MKVVILHAYSATNSGDGLLVNEALQLIRRVDESAQVVVLALDPASFEATPDVQFRHPTTGRGQTPSSARMLIAAARNLASFSLLHPLSRRLIRSADLVVGVGGGYMRSNSLLTAVKFALAHLPQLIGARRSRYAVYLPQSIGPMRWGLRGTVLRALRMLDVVAVRDGRSAQLLQSVPSAVRLPDTALLPIKDLKVAPKIGTGRVGLVARDLGATPRTRAYESGIRALADEFGASVVAQATGRGNDDRRFYAKLGLESSGSLRTALQSDERPSVLVSVRLHGAIESIRAGVPAVHLSYERKGWGAYEDLGIAEYVHNAFDFDEQLVAEQVEFLRADPTQYWHSVEQAQDRLRCADALLVKLLQESGEPQLDDVARARKR